MNHQCNYSDCYVCHECLKEQGAAEAISRMETHDFSELASLTRELESVLAELPSANLENN